MSKSSLRYRAAQRRALKSISLTQKPVASPTASIASGNASGWKTATFVGFNAESGQYQVRSLTGEITEVDRIPGYGAEFGGVSTGSSGLLSQGFWSN